jgi:hypothetical protein
MIVGTIYPSPLLQRLQLAGIRYACANPFMEDETYA